MTEPWWMALLREQQRSGFAGLAGAEGSVTLPISDRLLTSVVRARLPPAVPISSIDLQAEADGHFAVRLKLKAPAFLPPFTLRFAVTSQPQLPDWPVLVCTMRTQGISMLMGPLTRFFAALPPWVRVDRDRVLVNLRLLAAGQHASDLFDYLRDLRLTTEPGRFIVAARASVPERTTS